MADPKIFYLNNAGLIQIRKVYGIKNISIKISPFQGVNVTIPYRMSYSEAEKFIIKKQAWIIKCLKKVNELEKNYTVFDFNTRFKTRFHQLKILQHESENKIRLVVDKQFIYIYIPHNQNITDKNTQQTIRFAIEKALLHEARTYLPERVKELADKFNLHYNRLSLRNSKTRWGSCSNDNNITLSIHLMRLPEHLCDYIILHELCHTIHKNHSPAFWNQLDKMTGEARKPDRELKNYRIEIY